MKRERIVILLLSGALGLSLVGFGGCKNDRSTGGGNSANAANEGSASPVGVINFDTVAKGLGWADTLNTDIGIYKDRLQADLNTITRALETQVEKQRQSIAPNGLDKLTPQQQQELMKVQVNAQGAMQSFNQQAATQLTAYQRERVRRYRESLKPAIAQVAQQRKISVVIEQNDTLLYSDTGADVSDAVIGLARSQPPTVATVNMEPLRVPQGVTVSQNPATTQAATTGGATTRPAAAH